MSPGQNGSTIALVSKARAILGQVQGRSSLVLHSHSQGTLISELNALHEQLTSALADTQSVTIEHNNRNRRAMLDNTGTILSVDFSSDLSPTSPGWVKVGPHSRYNHTLGSVGWTSTSMGRVNIGPAPSALAQGKKVVSHLTCPFPDDAVLCTYLFSNTSERSTLRLGLRPGNYTVEVHVGEPSAMVTRVAVTNVWSADGELLAIGTRMPVPGEFTTVAFNVSVPTQSNADTPGVSTLELVFGGMSVTPFFQFDDRTDGTHFYTMAWLANALIIRSPQAQLSAMATKSLNRHAVVARGIRDWLVLGSLDDTNATCMDRRTPAEIGVNVSARYPRKGGGWTGWRRVALQSPLAYLDFIALGTRDDDGLGAITLALTHIFLPGNNPREVFLVGSTTAVGVGYLRGNEIFRDELNAGLMLEEEKIRVSLKPGWNELLIRSCTKWRAGGWGLWFTVRELDGILSNVKVQAMPYDK